MIPGARLTRVADKADQARRGSVGRAAWRKDAAKQNNVPAPLPDGHLLPTRRHSILVDRF
jgi:hypothetical protein